ncbi:GNAT family N-acetyltransferase [Pelagibius sp. Alg239-R121]|uniref:GNAT family N-acetyltransferase n=1 Tax=Pelagibius sp. Alg239-R121 TaxID=2993448 RepID=UPI0024A6BB6C|nr:GNAT family N-acetyltransferase [Pelagibius sp. Alg239-R121]
MSKSSSAQPLIRDATREDLPQIQAIYAHHVEHGLASFEETAPGLEEITARFEATLAGELPYLAAEFQGRIAGYAYAGAYRPRPAYRFSLENSVYVAPDAVEHGVGSALLSALIQRCAALGFRQLVAVIGDSANHASIGLHEKHGFTRAGQLKSIGFKFGRWVDSVIMQREIGEGGGTLPEEEKFDRSQP